MASQPVIWKGNELGLLHDIRIDNFHVYGRWEQTTDSLLEFVREIETEGEASVRLGVDPGLKCIVVSPPGDLLELRADLS